MFSSFCACVWGSSPAPILDTQGRIVLYHGVNVSNSAKYAEDHLPWHTLEDFARLCEWGFNMVRLLVFWEAIEPHSGEYNMVYVEALKERINWLESLGIDVLIDLHQDLYNRRFSGNGFPDWTVNDDGLPFTLRHPWPLNYLEPAVRASYRNFWTSDTLKSSYVDMLAFLLSHVDNLPNVVGLEIMNEPWPVKGICFERKILTPFYESVESMMKEHNYQTTLYFEPVIYTSAGLPSLLAFYPEVNAVYAAHYYDPLCHEGLPYTAFGRLLMVFALQQRIREANRFGTPLLYTEFGVSHAVPKSNQYLEDILNVLDAYQVGWTYYSYDIIRHSGNAIIDEEKNPLPTLNPLIRLYPQRIAGRNPNWFRTKNRFELQYDLIETDAPTVVYIPRTCTVTHVTINGQPYSFDHPESLYLVYAHPSDASERQSIVIEWE